MTTTLREEPWTKLEALVAGGDAAAVDGFLRALTPAETARVVSRLEETVQKALLGLLSPSDAAEMLGDLPDPQAAHLVADMPAPAAAAVVGALPANEQADLLADLRPAEAEAVLDAMQAEDADVARELMRYPAHTAGGLMTKEYLCYRDTASVDEVIVDLRRNRDRYSDYEVQYAYIVNAASMLVGVLPMRELLLASHETPISRLMIRNPVSVRVTTPLDRLVQLYEEHAYLGIPVVEAAGRLVGVLRRSAVAEAEQQQARSIFLKLSGIVGGEELRAMPLTQRALRRLSWLAPNIVLNMMAASVIALYQETLQAAIALAVFLPIISDMSGCSGNQAVAVSIRELALGLIRPAEFRRVFLKEVGVGLLNGVLLGALLGGVAYLWKGNVYLGLVVGAALALNTLLAVLLGGSVPLLLRRCGVDPALASGPLLTTVTDLCGFFFVLSFASATLPRLM